MSEKTEKIELTQEEIAQALGVVFAADAAIEEQLGIKTGALELLVAHGEKGPWRTSRGIVEIKEVSRGRGEKGSVPVLKTRQDDEIQNLKI